MFDAFYLAFTLHLRDELIRDGNSQTRVSLLSQDEILNQAAGREGVRFAP